MQRTNKKSLILGVIATILIGIAALFSVRIYTPTIFFHLQFPTNTWAVIAFLLCLPSVIATVGMSLRKMWSLPLSAFLALALSVISTRYFIVNLKTSSLYPEEIVFVFIVIAAYFSLFLLLTFSSDVKHYFNFQSGYQGAKEYLQKHLFGIIGCLLILLVVQIICARQYLYYQQYPWPPPEMANQEIHKKWPFFVKGNIANEDIEKILSVVNRLENIDYRIFAIVQRDEKSILVITGEMIAPLWGAGNEVELKKVNSIWEVVKVSEWIS